MKQIIILGTGGNCLDILDVLLDINKTATEPRYRVCGFLDDNQRSWGKQVQGFPVLGALAAASKFPDCAFVNGIGSPSNYWRKPDIIATTGLPLQSFETVIAPSASVSRSAVLGPGTVLLPNVTINARAVVGSHVIILPGSVISHDAQVGDFSCVSAGVVLSGSVQIGRACYLGANSTLVNNVRIGDESLVGAGAVVLKDVAARTVVVGNPARVLRAVPVESK